MLGEGVETTLLHKRWIDVDSMSDVMACACTFTFFEPLAGTMLVFVLEPDADEFMLGIVISTGEDFYLAGFFFCVTCHWPCHCSPGLLTPSYSTPAMNCWNVGWFGGRENGVGMYYTYRRPVPKMRYAYT